MKSPRRNNLCHDGESPHEDEMQQAAAGPERGETECGHCITDFVNDVSPREREKLSRALWSGEHVRWATRPLPHLWNNRSLARFVLGLIWMSFYAFVLFQTWEQQFGALAESDPGGVRISFTTLLRTLPFWAVGLWLLSGPWRQRRLLRRTLYIITSQRVLVSEAGRFSWNMQSWELAGNIVARREELSQDRGCLIFREGQHTRAGEPGIRLGGFLYLGNMTRAEKELRSALEDKRRRRKHPR